MWFVSFLKKTPCWLEINQFVILIIFQITKEFSIFTKPFILWLKLLFFWQKDIDTDGVQFLHLGLPTPFFLKYENDLPYKNEDKNYMLKKEDWNNLKNPSLWWLCTAYHTNSEMPTPCHM